MMGIMIDISIEPNDLCGVMPLAPRLLNSAVAPRS